MVTLPADVVRAFFERMEARRWDSAGELLSPRLCIEFTETGEVFNGANFLAMNRAFPEGWSIEVVEIVADGHRVATQVRVEQDGTTHWCAGFYEVTDGMIESGVEHWVTEKSQPAPRWRQKYAS